jgi:hypothetical protein
MTVKKKLSMAERLAQIANPTPSSEDIETIPDGARISRNADDEFEYDDYAGLTTQVLMEFNLRRECLKLEAHTFYTTCQPSVLRRDLGLDIVDDPKYKGVTVSRRQLMAVSDDDDDDDDDDDESQDAEGDADGASGEENDLIGDEEQSEVGIGDEMECGMGDLYRHRAAHWVQEYETGDSQSEGEDEEGSQSDEDESDGYAQQRGWPLGMGRPQLIGIDTQWHAAQGGWHGWCGGCRRGGAAPARGN